MAKTEDLIAYTLIAGDLDHDVLVETGADRVGALAFAKTLGSTLLRLRVANDVGAYRKAHALLVKAMCRPHEHPGMISKVCRVALDEWVHDKCTHCMGRRYLLIEGTPYAKAACPKCNGSGVGRHSDKRRMVNLGVNKHAYAKWETKIADVHQLITGAVPAACRTVDSQLERGHFRKVA